MQMPVYYTQISRLVLVSDNNYMDLCDRKDNVH